MTKIFIGLALALTLAGSAAGQLPQFGHVVLVMEESHSYSSVIGNASMPYLNSLAQDYGLAANFYANTHPSIGNYFELTTGQVVTNNDGYCGTVSADNVVRELMVAGKTWKSYAESLPSVGYTGCDQYPYVKHHNPLSYFTDVVNSSNEKMNLVPFQQFGADLAAGQLPNFSFIVPNMLDDAHDGSLSAGDTWLKTQIAPLLADPQFQKDGLLIISFDESVTSDTAHGGGHIAVLVISPSQSKRGYKSQVFYQFPSVLKTVLQSLGASAFPGASASAPAMTDFFASATPTPSPICTASTVTNTVTICAPANNGTVTGRVDVNAITTSSSPVSLMQIYVDGAKKYEVAAASLNTTLALAAGTHRITVQAYNSSTIFKSTVYTTVQ